MNDELTDADYRRIFLKLSGQESVEERPARGRYAFSDQMRFERWSAQRAEMAAAEKPKPVDTNADASGRWEEWLDTRIAAALQADGQIGEVIAECLAEVFANANDEREAREALAGRICELEIRASQQDVAIAKRDVEIAKQDIAIAELQSRLATGGKGGVIDAHPSMKSIN
jgi:hypothetical protein